MAEFKFLPRSEYTLAEVVANLASFGFTRLHLVERLRDGRVQSICRPWRHEQNRPENVTSDDWKNFWPRAEEQPLYADHIGNARIGESENPPAPVTIIPSALEHVRQLARRHGHKSPIESATVFITHGELEKLALSLGSDAARALGITYDASTKAGRRGPRAEKLRQTIERMVDDITAKRLKVEDIEEMKEQAGAARYEVSRDTFRKARHTVLNQIPTNTDKKQKATTDEGV